jgi:FdhD protein
VELPTVTHPLEAAGTSGPVTRRTVAVAVLAGGGSRRMGRDKAAVEVEGRTLLERTLRAAGSVASPGAPVTVVGSPSSPTSAALGRWVPDLRPDEGPLAGLETALVVAGDMDAVLVVGVDHPWLEPAVLNSLIDSLLATPDHLDAVVLGTGDGPQPLLGAYRPSARHPIGALLDTGERRLHTLLDHLRLEVLTPDRWRHLDPLGATAVDVDDAATLAAATRWHARASATLPVTDRAEDAATPRGSGAANPDRLNTPLTPGTHDRGSGAATPDRLDAPGRRVLHVRPGTSAEPAGTSPASPSPASPSPTSTSTTSRSPTSTSPTSRASTPAAAGDTDSIEVEAHVDVLLGEEPLEICAAGPEQEPVTLATILRTPGHEPELAVGWILAQGLATAADVMGTTAGGRSAGARRADTITVRLRHDVTPSTLTHGHMPSPTSGRGCGRATLAQLAARVPPVEDGPFRRRPLRWSVLARLPEELRLAQGRARTTGGVQAAGLFDADGRLVTVREDVGRHNALDAAIGAHAVAGVWPEHGLDDLVCVLTSRVGFELVAKAAVARIPIVASMGAASDLAARTAEQLGITLVGGLRHGDGVVYTHPERLLLPAPQ